MKGSISLKKQYSVLDPLVPVYNLASPQDIILLKKCPNSIYIECMVWCERKDIKTSWW